MSFTYFYLLSPETIRSTAALVDSFRTSKAAFEGFLAGWGNYSHDAFLRDLEAKRPHGREIYYLAHQLIVNRKEIESVSMHVELHLLFLDGYWVPRPRDEAAIPEAARPYLDAKKAGVRIRWDSSPERERAAIELMGDLPPEIKRRLTSRKRIHTESDLREHLESAGFSSAFVQDAVLINRLCNGRRPPEPRTVAGFSIWIVAGWDNYEGHLTGADLRSMAVEDQTGFLSLFRRAVDSGPESERWQAEIVDRLVSVREKMIALGEDSLCIAISSL